MSGKTHEIRDPIHVFIRLDSDEREVLDSKPFQRLREIRQLAPTYLVFSRLLPSDTLRSRWRLERTTRAWESLSGSRKNPVSR